MKIAVNTRLLLKGKLEGIGWYTYETMKRIVKNNPEHTFYFLFDRAYDESFVFGENVIPVVLNPQARHPFLFWIWFEISVCRFLKKTKVDLFLSPDGYLSLSTKTPSLAVIHDLNFEHYPKDLPWLVRKYYRYFFPRFAKKASRIVTVSEFSKKDIQNQYKIDAEKIDVTLNGMNADYKKCSDEDIQATKQRFSNNEDYFLFIGSLQPRKNLVNMFKAFDLFKKEHSSQIKLLIVGEKKWWTKDISAAYQGMHHKNEVVFLGRLEPKDLCKVLSSSLALVYVSYFEGFGIPIIEAYRCGTAVITSNVTSMPEVAGDAALLVDPFSVTEISNAMSEITFNKELRDELIAKGQIRKDDFSWDITAEKLWESVEKTINQVDLLG